ncbi:hypothetical protein L227DRAFT_581972 [Lentinus tigrinus ALCF2SS1-6]|uniref:Macrofage activating glyco protein n=1 Tax=Lentinus tigrinus ALCF2SS1-6 TaxID=1328759 RepID=A0A5C2RQ80_9APHY|nr:hypothetical protein L227DRAFT_581972 [Lentinus tigrinus ALCF2SS1-6]
MSTVALSLLAIAAASSGVLAQDATTSSLTPLASKHFDYTNLPYQADPDNGVRGTQQGYNRCNSTTEGPESMCQTALINHLDDFCLWAPPKPDSTIGDTEGEEVAWCTKKGYGTRLIPAGALTGVQLTKTPDYIQVVGYIDQTKINIAGDDGGGELDPHGADFRGNPLGGLVYSNAFTSNGGKNDSFQQVIEWHNFMGSNQFCFKICDPAGSNPAGFCQHIYDRIGVAYNCPTAAQNGTFEYCEGESQDPPGIYTDASGAVQTYSQPPESLGVITSLPYTPKVPASSNCVQIASAALFTDLASATASATASGSGASATGSSKATGSGASGSATRTGASAGASSTGGAASGDSNGAATIRISAAATFAGVLGAIAFLA